VVTDLSMPGMDGLALLAAISARDPELPGILLTAHGSERVAVAAMKTGAHDYLAKPFDIDEVAVVIERALETRRLRRDNRRFAAEQALGRRIIATSRPMRRVLEAAERIATRDVTVLVRGETGTGKELVAQLLHVHSPRASGPLIRFNCAAIPAELAESELFGHARGAFTGAAGARAGLIEHASGGTLFLDEIGTMPAGVQAKLLRALEAGEVRRIGENDVRNVDVRFVAATNADLQASVDAGSFRSDLFYRLNVHHIHLPPLRERPGDVARLLDFFMERVGPPAGVTGFSDEARAALLTFDYPGNVRQLEHVIQRAVAVARGQLVETVDLPEELFAGRTADPQSVAADTTVAAARERAEREMIVATLARNHGEVSSTARELQVSRTTLWRLMKKHQI
jgi:two-component system response regulator AtoC